MAFEDNVFINCPFDDGYNDLLRPLLFCVLALGFEPRIALERADTGEARLEKITELIKDSKYSIHDLSRTRAAAAGEYARMNMPYELGVDWGCKIGGDAKFADKRFLVLEDIPHELKQALSDISGYDVEAHRNEPARVCKIIRDWLAQSLPGGVLALPPSKLWGRFNEFMADNYVKLKAEHYSDEDIAEQPIRELVVAMRTWLRPPPAGGVAQPEAIPEA